MSTTEWILIIILALIIDYFIEYPNPIHPTVWMGKIIGFFDDHRLLRSNRGLIINGILPIIFDTSIFFLLVYIINFLPLYLEIPIYVYLAKSTFSIGGLVKAIKNVKPKILKISG